MPRLSACALVSLILSTITSALPRRTGLPFGEAVRITILGLLALVVGAVTFFGKTIEGEFAELTARLPTAWAAFQKRLRTSAVGASIPIKVQGLAKSGQAVVHATTTARAAVGRCRGWSSLGS